MRMSQDHPPDRDFRDRPYFFDAGVRFTCTGCGACCTGAGGRVWLEAVDVEALTAHLGMDREGFLAAFTREQDGRRCLVDHPDGSCVFLDHARCRVHGAKPRQCRTFPFWLDNLRNPEAWARTAKACEGIGQGRLYSREEILHIIHGLGDAVETDGPPEP